MKNRTVLIVDDREDMIQAVKMMIKVYCIDHGIEEPQITTTQNAHDAIDLIDDSVQPFDIVITDFRIPEKSEGLLVASAAKMRSPSTFTVGMSTDVSEGERAIWKIDAFMNKPIKVDAFRHIFNHAFLHCESQHLIGV